MIFIGLEMVAEVIWPHPVSRIGWHGALVHHKSGARQLIQALHLYAEEHEGRYPDTLDDLKSAKIMNWIPDIYLGDDSPHEAWSYVRGKTPKSPPGDLIIVSPVIVSKAGILLRAFWTWRGYLNPLPEKPTRIIGLNDGSALDMTEEQFQKWLNNTRQTMPGPSPTNK